MTKFSKLADKGRLTLPKRMNFRKSSKGGGGHFQSKNLCCKIWTLKQGYLTIKLIQNLQKKNDFYFGGLPLWIYVTLFVMSHWSIPIRHFSKCSQVGLEVAGLFSLSHFLPTSPSRCCPLVLWLPPNPFKRTDQAAVQGRPTTLVKKET